MRAMIEDFVDCKNSLDKAISTAGGVGLTFTALYNMTALDLIDLISTNEIRFVCLLDAVARSEVKNPTRTTKPVVINLTGAEIQSGLNRQRAAENLLVQLPVGHNGRDSWLLNYGIGELAKHIRLNHSGGAVKWNPKTEAAETVGGATNGN